MAVILFNDTNNDGDPSGAETVRTYDTIQQALAAAAAGQSLYIQNGEYAITSTLVISTSVKIYGQSEAGVILDASTATGTGIWATADGFRMQNLTIKGPANGTYGLKVGPDSGIAGETTDNVTLSRITVQGSGSTEFDINGVNGGTFTNLTANGLGTAGNGIALVDSANITISGLATNGNGRGSIRVQDGTTFDLETANIVITGHTTGTTSGAAGGMPEAQVYAESRPGGQSVNALLDAVTINGAQSWVVYNAGGVAVGFAEEAGARAYAATLAANSYAIEKPDGAFVVDAGMSIQVAIDAADAGDTILVAAGTYSENLVIGKALTIQGLTGAVLKGTFRSDNAIAAGTDVDTWLRTAIGDNGASGTGITVNAADVAITGLAITEFKTGITLGAADRLALTDVAISQTINGIAAAAGAHSIGLRITGGSIAHGYEGITTGAAVLDDVVIDDVTFEHLLSKGIYTESLNNADLTDLTMTDVGVYGRVVYFGGAGVFGAGIDLNLKRGSYSDIEISGFEFTGVGTSNGGTATASATGAAIAVKGRDDGSNAGTLSNVRILDGTIDGTSTAIRIGEPGKTNAGPSGVVVTDVAVTGAALATLDNVSQSVLTFNGSQVADTVTTGSGATGAIVINGGDGADALSGGIGGDTLRGEAGDDTLQGGAGDDALDGGVGTDTAAYAGAASGYTVVAADDNGDGRADRFATVTGAGTDTLTAIDKVSFANGATVYDLAQAVQLFDAGNAIVGTFDTIQAAVDAASANYTVVVAAGTYAETVTVDRDVTIKGANAGAAGAGPRGGETIITGGVFMAAAGATLDGVKLSGGGLPGGVAGAVYVAANDVTLTNLVIQDDGDGTPYGFHVTGGVLDLAISSSLVTGWSQGGYVNPGTRFSVTGTTFDGNGNAFVGDDWADGTSIDGNTFRNSQGSHISYTAFDPAEDFGRFIGTNSYDGTNPREFAVAAHGDGDAGGQALTGTNQRDLIYADNASADATTDDTFYGLGGNDVLQGGAGDDTLVGGSGNDSIEGGTGDDTAVFADGGWTAIDVDRVTPTGRVTAINSVTTVSEGHDSLTGVEAIAFNGATVVDINDPVQLFDASNAIVGTFDTIQAAVDAASAGYTILLAAGRYDETVKVDEDVTIKGPNAGTPGAAGTRVAEAIITGGVVVSAAGAALDGVKLLGGAAAASNGGAVYVGANDVTLTNLVIADDADGTAYGFHVTGGLTGLSIGDSLVTGWYQGGYVNPGTRFSVTGTTFDGNVNAFVGEGWATGTSIDGNTFRNSTRSHISYGVDTSAEDFGRFIGTNSYDGTNPREFGLSARGDGDAGGQTVTGTGERDLISAEYGRAAGSGEDDTFSGLGGDDVLAGGAGDDTLIGGTGDDALSGGAGDDIAVVTGGYTVAATSTGWTVTSTDGTDTLDDVEIVSIGSGAKTLLVGNGGYATLADAMADAANGDTILLAVGSYAGDATIDKAVTIRGANAGIAGSASGRGAESVLAGQLTVTAAVVIDGVEILNGSGPSTAFVGIRVNAAVNVTVRNSRFYADQPTQAGTPLAGPQDYGIYLTAAAGGVVLIEDNAFTGAQQGAGDKYGTANWTRSVWSDGAASSLTVARNTFDNVRTGINLDGFDDARTSVTGNLFSNSGTGIAIGSPVTNTITGIRDNQFTDVDTDFNLANVTTGQSFDLAATNNVGTGATTGIVPPALLVVTGSQAADTLTGGAGSEYLVANAGADTLDGGAGNDRLEGGAGNDTIRAGDGDDAIDGGADTDTLVLRGGFRGYAVTANSDGSYTIVDTDLTDGNDGTDTVRGVERVRLGGVNGTDYSLADLPDDAPVANDDDNLPTAGDPNDPGDALKEDVDSLAVGNVLANDVNTDAQFGDVLTVTSITGGTQADVSAGAPGLVDSDYGILSMSADGTWRYELDGGRTSLQVLAEGQVVTQIFTYVVKDRAGNSDTATLTLTIVGTNDKPYVSGGTTTGTVVEAGNDDGGAVLAGTPDASGTLTARDADANATLTWSGDADGTYGTFAITGGGAWTYLLDNTRAATQALKEGDILTETFTATVSDGLATAQQTVTITVRGTNDSPVASAEATTATEDGAAVTGTLADNVADVDGTTRTFALDAPVAGLTLNSDGSYSFDPSNAAYQSIARNAPRVVTASYTATDEFGATSSSTLTITVTGTNDAPVLIAVDGTPKTFAESRGPIVDNFGPSSGTLTVNDVDNPDSVTGAIVSAVVTFNGAAPSGATQTAIANGLTRGQGGTGDALTFGTVATTGSAASLTWTYDPGAVNLKTLSEEDTVTITYTVRVKDAADASSAQTETIVINVKGVNERFNGDANPDNPDDTITGTGNADDVFGGGGDDSINAGGGNDDVYGGEGDDSILGGGGNDEVYGGDGDDMLDGASGADILYGGGGDDILSGGSENDSFYVGAGDATVNGGSGTGDTLYLDGAWSSYTIARASSNTYTIEGAEGQIVASFVENFAFLGNAPGQTGPFTAAQILNDKPVAANDSGDAGNVLGNDTDPDSALGDSRTVTGIRTGTEAAGGAFATVATGTTIAGRYGVLTIDANGTYSYAVTANDPDTLALGNVIATETFTYEMKDAKGLADTAQISITVQGTNNPPVAVDDAFTIGEDAVTTFTAAQLVGNDTDANGNALSVQSVGNASGGTAVLNADGSVTFTPTPNFNGAAGFDYVVSDGNNGTDTGRVTLTVTPVNDAPVAQADGYSVAEDGVLSVPAASGVLANDGDVDRDALSAVLVAGPAHGTLALNPDGSFTYTPTANYNGTDSFTYTASDGTTTGAPVTVTIAVAAVNDAAVAQADSYSVGEDGVLTVAAAAGLLANDSDADGNPLTASLATAPANGTLALNPDGSFTYTPNANYNGTDSFTYTASDGTTTSAPVTVTITVASVNDAPTAVAESFTVAEDAVLTVAVADLLANDGDVDGGTLSVTAVGNATNGTVALGNGQVVFTPTADYNGPASFDYTISDGQGGTATATVSVTVNGVNDAPVAANDTASAVEDTPLVIDAATLIGNDRDGDGDALTVTAVGGAVNGTVSLGGGQITFTPDADYTGPASFTYTVSDGTLTSTATVDVTVAPVNDAPVAAADTLSVAEDTPTTFQASALLGNDTDIDGGTLTLASVTSGTGGSVSLNGDGTFTFTPAADFNGTATFSYVVSDGTTTSTGTASVTVTPVNDAPMGQLSGNLPDGAEDVPYTVSEAALLAGFVDVEGDGLSVVNLAASNGTVGFANGVYTITPAADYAGPVILSYGVSDGQATSTGYTRSYTLAAADDAPVANDDSLNATEDQAVTFTAAQLLGNDTDVDTANAALVIASVTAGANGTAVLNADGTVTFTANADFNGIATFTYTVSDGALTSAPATATVTVASVNDAPTGAPAFAFPDGTEDYAYVVRKADLLAGFGDADGDALTATITSVSNASFVDNGTSYTITPDANYNGAVSISYLVSDGTTATPATQAITFAAVNDAPVAVIDTLNAVEDTVATFDVEALLGNDTDVDNDPIQVVSVADGTGGTVSLANGVVTFTPAADFNGVATFTYQLSDGTTTTTGQARVNVAAVNDAPRGATTGTLPNGTEDTAYTVSKADLLAGFTDPEGSTLQIVGFSASNGTVVDNGASYTITPGANDNGTVTLTYAVSDGQLATAATRTYTLAAVNDAPVAAADTLSATEDTVATFAVSALLGNDTDVDRDALSILSVTSGTGGTVSLANGVVTFTPTANFNGAASFTYTLGDGTTTTTGTATVNVAAVNDAAVITGTRTGTVTEDGTLTTGGDLDVADPDTGEAKFAGTSGTRAGTHGTYTFDVDTGVWSYQLNNADPAVQALATGQSLTDQITVQSLDGTTSTTLQVTINGTDEPLTGVVGTNGDDNLNGTSASENMYGLDGNDTLNGSAGSDRLFGGNGTDTANYAASAAVVSVSLATGDGIGGDAAGDSYSGIENVTGSALADLLIGDGGANVLIGSAGNDTLNGNGGNDTLVGGTGNDAMAGGLGNDTYDVDSASDTVNEAAGEGTDTVRTTLVTYTLGNTLENLVYTGAAAFTGNGNALNNAITGGTGADRLDGRGGADTMTGLGGNDTYTVDDTGDVVIEAASEGTDTVNASVDYVLGANVENLTLVGTALNATGNASDNVLKGTAGNNRIDGGAGVDNMFGYGGDDTYVVDLGDIVNEADGGGYDTIETALSTLTLRTFVEKLVYTGTGDFVGTGNVENNTIVGGVGNDRLDGRTGADTMIGGAGDDSYAVDNAGDVIVETAGGGTDEVFVAAADYTLGDHVERVTMGGTARNLVAGAGNTVILGNGQINRIDGGAGADTMTGFAGNDTFVFQRGQANGDTVTDFAGAGVTGGDVLELRGYGTIASGASIVRVGATDSYLITADAAHGGGTDTITLSNVFGLTNADVVFL